MKYIYDEVIKVDRLKLQAKCTMLQWLQRQQQEKWQKDIVHNKAPGWLCRRKLANIAQSHPLVAAICSDNEQSIF